MKWIPRECRYLHEMRKSICDIKIESNKEMEIMKNNLKYWEQKISKKSAESVNSRMGDGKDNIRA